MPNSDDSSDFDLTSSVGYAGGIDAATTIAIAGEIVGGDGDCETASQLPVLFQLLTRPYTWNLAYYCLIFRKNVY